jgi:hypothetical protein
MIAPPATCLVFLIAVYRIPGLQRTWRDTRQNFMVSSTIKSVLSTVDFGLGGQNEPGPVMDTKSLQRRLLQRYPRLAAEHLLFLRSTLAV